jgi:hypothetical protein
MRYRAFCHFVTHNKAQELGVVTPGSEGEEAARQVVGEEG